MNRQGFPSGQAGCAVLKALLRSLEATKGHGPAVSWLSALRLDRADLDNEARLVPLSQLHAALKAFVELASPDAIVRAWPYLIAPDNLGGWVRVLRGTTTPAEAFARLGASDSEYARTTRWETIESGPGYWRGRVHTAHDPRLEADGLLQRARVLELTCVPALYGLGPGAVTVVERPPSRTGVAQEFEVRWKAQGIVRAVVVGALVGEGIAALPLLVHPSLAALAWSAMGLIFGGGVGGLFARDRVRRAESVAQATRLHALERSLLLREARERQPTGGLEGQIVAGQFRIHRRMGSGASGVIYEAERTSDGLPVALKLLRAVAAHEAAASDRLRREAEALRLAWHPNIVEVLDHGVLGDGTVYLAMELLRGETLGARLRAKGRLTPEELLPIATQVCDALAAVHAAGVVHRDLKPSNIFLAKAPGEGGERVKIIDFGIAHVEWQETRITNTGAPVGTPGYMSPEQEAGGEVDARSDVFALGSSLYECLVGEPPPPIPSGLWTASAPTSRFAKGGADSGTTEAAKLIPEAWRPLLDKAVAILPRDRFADARAMTQGLREVGDKMERARARASR